MADQLTANGIPVYRDSGGVLREYTSAPSTSATAAQAGADRDTDGNSVPIYKPHAFSYDNSGNLSTDTVTDGTSTWVRTYTYTATGPETDSGWVKQ